MGAKTLLEVKELLRSVKPSMMKHGTWKNAHYGGNAKTYMNVGLGMGKAMVELLKNK